MPYKDREQRLQYNRQYDLLKRDKLKEKARKAKYYQKNKDKVLQRCKQYFRVCAWTIWWITWTI